MKKITKEFKKYEQLFRMQISKLRYIVISRTIDDRISMVQQIRVHDYEGEDEYLYLKNAFIFESIEIFEIFRKNLQKFTIRKDDMKNEQLKLFDKKKKEEKKNEFRRID